MANTKRIVASLIVLGLTQTIHADVFGSGTSVLEIEFVSIPGDAGNLGSWNAGINYTFSGVNRDDYRISTFEITNNQWNTFKEVFGPMTGDPSESYNDESYWPNPNVPTNMVSWYEAAQFVNWLNTSTGHHAAYKFTGTPGHDEYGDDPYTLGVWSTAEADGTNIYRHKDAFYYLPTEDEWVKAAYWNGTSIQTFSNASPDDLIDGRPNPSLWNYVPSEGNQPWDVGSGGQAEINGTYDMMGNVWEWLESPYYSGDYGVTSIRGARGGAYYHDNLNMLASSGRYNESVHSVDNGFGFRIAANVPEPASIAFLYFGGLAILRRCKRYQ